MKKIRVMVVMLLVLSLLLVGCNVGEPLNADKVVSGDLLVEDTNGIDESKLSLYTIDVELDTEDMSYKGKQYVKYVNNTDVDLEEIYFHIYPNAFKSLEDAPVLFNTEENMNKKEYVPGYIDIEKVSLGNKDLDWNIEGDKDTILNIDLGEELKKGETIELYLEYNVKLPSTKDRFGYYEKGINLGNWYPILAVYDEDGWNLDPYYKVGDPFYSDISNYKVSITTPKDIVVAASGVTLSEEIIEDKRVHEIEGKLIRDFAWVASEDFVVEERLVDDTLIKFYSINGNKKLIKEGLDYTENSIKTFNKIFGKYPYKEYKVVNTEFPSGMEYPNIVLISNDYFTNSLKNVMEIVIVHETAHQWWYGLVGNDQIDEAWLDEGLTTYSETIYMGEVYGEEIGKKYYDQSVRYGYEYGSKYLGEDKVVNKSLPEFAGWDDYGILVYTRAAMFIDKIREDYGEDTLYEILKTYFSRYRFYNAKAKDFINICEEVTGESFTDIVNEYVNKKD